MPSANDPANEPRRSPFTVYPADYVAGAKPKGKLPALIGTGAAAALIALVGAWEGKRNDPYRDIVGVWTVCYGETNVAMRRWRC